jgi:tetratricopeptide (TPR) repeat protein
MRPVAFAILIGGLLGGCAAHPPATGVEARPAGVDYYVQALEASKAGNREQAITLLEKAVAVNPELRMPHVLLGDAYRAEGDYERAATQYEAATRLDQYSYTNHYNLGLTYHFMNRLQDAARSYLKALQLNPRDVKSNMNLGLVYLALGDFNSAVLYLQKATQLDPNSAQAWSNLGVAYDTAGKPVEAEATYRKAIELNSNDVVTLQNLSQNLISQKKSDEAVQIMRRAIAISDTPSTRKHYADALAADKQYDKAIEQYDVALKSDPRYLGAMNDKGFAMIGQYVTGLQLDDKLRTAALDLWHSSLKANPNQPRIAEAVRKWENPSLFGG